MFFAYYSLLPTLSFGCHRSSDLEIRATSQCCSETPKCTVTPFPVATQVWYSANPRLGGGSLVCRSSQLSKNGRNAALHFRPLETLFSSKRSQLCLIASQLCFEAFALPCRCSHLPPFLPGLRWDGGASVDEDENRLGVSLKRCWCSFTSAYRSSLYCTVPAGPARAWQLWSGWSRKAQTSASSAVKGSPRRRTVDTSAYGSSRPGRAPRKQSRGKRRRIWHCLPKGNKRLDVS